MWSLRLSCPKTINIVNIVWIDTSNKITFNFITSPSQNTFQNFSLLCFWKKLPLLPEGSYQFLISSKQLLKLFSLSLQSNASVEILIGKESDNIIPKLPLLDGAAGEDLCKILDIIYLHLWENLSHFPNNFHQIGTLEFVDLLDCPWGVLLFMHWQLFKGLLHCVYQSAA